MHLISVFMNVLCQYEHLQLAPLNRPPNSSLSSDIQSSCSYVIFSSSSSSSSPCVRAGYNTAQVMKSGWESQWLPSCSLCLSLFLALLSDEASCHVASCPREKPTWQKSRGGWQPSAISHQGTEVFSPISREEPNPANSHASDLGSGSFPGWAWRGMQTVNTYKFFSLVSRTWEPI